MPSPRLTPLAALDMNEPATGNVRRLFPRRSLLHLDPFVRFEELVAEPPSGLPPHEHRGFESVTLLLEGALEHTEVSQGSLVAQAGDVIRLTTGRGCFHAERPPLPGPTHALQVWIALGLADRELLPEVQHVTRDLVPETRPKGLVRRVVLGAPSPVTLRTAAGWIDLAFTGSKTQLAEPIPARHQGFVYVTHGEVHVGDHRMGPGDALLFSAAATAATIALEARKGARLALVHGLPRNEPIRAWGTVVD